MYQPTLVVHIDESLDNTHIYDLERDLILRDGVLSACVSDSHRHLMVVDYDADTISSGEIIAFVRGSGVHAELIGL